MSSDKASIEDTGITNFRHTSDPRALTENEVAGGYEEPPAPNSETYHAIMRRDGEVGQNIGRHTPSPKVRLLFVTADGQRAVERLQRASRTDGEHKLDGSYAVAIEREVGHGDHVNREEDQRRYSQLVDELHGGGD